MLTYFWDLKLCLNETHLELLMDRSKWLAQRRLVTYSEFYSSYVTVKFIWKCVKLCTICRWNLLQLKNIFAVSTKLIKLFLFRSHKLKPAILFDIMYFLSFINWSRICLKELSSHSDTQEIFCFFLWNLNVPYLVQKPETYTLILSSHTPRPSKQSLHFRLSK